MTALGSQSTPQPLNAHGFPIPVSPASSQPPINTPSEPTIPYSWDEWHPNVQLIYIRDHLEANRELERLDSHVYGFDLEWKPTFVKGQAKNPVALVQIANHKTILLLQVTAMQEFPSKLCEFLANPNIVKAGVGIQGDAQKLYEDWGVDMANCADLGLLARTVDNDKWKGKYTNPLGLARLVAVYEDRMLGKGKITRSNWERVLTEPQQIYAANDAHAGYVIYTRLMTIMPSVSPQPNLRCYSFDTVRGRLCEPSGATWRAFNPNYDPGPLPPPREPKPPKPRKPATDTATEPSNHAIASIARGPGNATALPAPQSISNPLRVSDNRGNRGFRGNSSPRPPNHAQPRPFQFPSQSNPTFSRFDNNSLRRYGPPGPRTSQPRYPPTTGREIQSPAATTSQPSGQSSCEMNKS
ncbi:ribonuclease H-like protein [Macrolepiota fuliginosa MF-IS2]|uniref:3'-5' exonuclease n=1 Tax=Macrolepiota fuliginosa MF-IS2 TaxID=1400762 RepID=A0A9P6C553_9AGAR|nr:ribonuclease H-like protein [Macrolepiota fuliginosa MF-IS2]